MLKKLPKGYLVLWACFAVAYLVWTVFFLRWDTYPQNETGILYAWVYPLWIACSTVLLLLFPVYMIRFLYSAEQKADQAIALLLLVVGCTFVTAYGFLKNPRAYTASMIGLEYPWSFKIWGLLSTASIFINTLYMYRKFGYRNNVGLSMSSVGCAALFITINVPSAGEDLILNSLRCMSHWTGALVFAFGCAIPVLMFLIHMAKTKAPKWIAVAVFFCVIFVLMTTLLIVVGKDGIIEGIPVWSVYLVMLLVNFTFLFPAPSTTITQTAEETNEITIS